MGAKLKTVGAMTTKSVALWALPPGVETPILPLGAPLGTVARITVSDCGVKLAAAPPKLTPVTAMRLVPFTVTWAPGEPFAGVNDVIVGGGGGSETVSITSAGRFA